MSMKVCRSISEIPPGYYLSDCAVSGGTLEGFLKSALRLSDGKLCLRLASQAVVFPLPCFDGKGSPLPQPQMEQLKSNHPSHFSPGLLMSYLTFQRQGQLHILLFDTPETLQKKQQLAETLGVPLMLRSLE